MRIDAAIRSMQRDRAPQRRAQAALVAACETWTAGASACGVWAELERFGAGADLADCGALAGIFAAGDALAWVSGLCRVLCAALAEQPLGHPPFRHGYDGEVASLLLARSGRTSVVLQSREPVRRAWAAAVFSDARRWDVVLAGRARGRIVRYRGRAGPLASVPIELTPGQRLGLHLARESLQVTRVERRLVTLRLHRTAANPAPTREHALADGVLLRQSSGDLAASRHWMMLALLARMGRAEAAPVLAAMACEPGEDTLRWQAVRECLALDSAAGFRTLGMLAHRGEDPLAAPAGALRAQLLEAHPQLLALEEARPCPA